MNDVMIEARTMWEPNSGCLIWLGSINHDGYGQIGINYNNHLAHRVVYAVKKGPTPPGICVLHRCDNRLCVNPDHLFLGTRPDNTADMVKKGRWGNKTFKGEENGSSKITASIAMQIREAKGFQYEIAKRFGVSPSLVSQIKRRVIWAHV